MLDKMICEFFPEFRAEHDRIYIINPDFSTFIPSSGPLAGIVLRALNSCYPSPDASMICVIDPNSGTAFCAITKDIRWKKDRFVVVSNFVEESYANNLKDNKRRISNLLTPDLYLNDNWVKLPCLNSDWEFYSCSIEAR